MKRKPPTQTETGNPPVKGSGFLGIESITTFVFSGAVVAAGEDAGPGEADGVTLWQTIIEYVTSLSATISSLNVPGRSMSMLLSSVFGKSAAQEPEKGGELPASSMACTEMLPAPDALVAW